MTVQTCRTCPSTQVELQFHPYPWCRGCIAQASHLKQDYLPLRGGDPARLQAMLDRIDEIIRSRAGFAPGAIIIRTKPTEGATQ